MSSLSYLSPSERERLHGLPFAVALPDQLAPGWKVEPLKIVDHADDSETYVKALFRGPGSQSLAVLTANGGLGDAMPGDSERVLDHSVFGPVFVIETDATQEEVSSVATQWFPVGGENAEFFHSVHGEDVDAATVDAFVASLVLMENT